MLPHIIDLVRETGQVLLRSYNGSNVKSWEKKSMHEIVTEADMKAEKMIISSLQKKYPEIGILSEEAGKVDFHDEELFWVIDPLDGTTNYAMHNPLWAVSLALIKNKKPILAVTYSPILDEMYYAVEGQGAYLNEQRIYVSKIDKLEDSIMTHCYGYNQKYLERITKTEEYFRPIVRTTRQFGSAALELAYVAAGRAEAYLIQGTNSWDLAPGALLVREAGGIVTDQKGIKWTTDEHSILAANSKIHSKYLDELSKI
ncbi:inositol monophosphatase family protein [Patescibacteria group bacterium]